MTPKELYDILNECLPEGTYMTSWHEQSTITVDGSVDLERLAARLSRNHIIEECARVCDLLAGLNVQGWGRKSTSAAQKCATEIRALKLPKGEPL